MTLAEAHTPVMSAEVVSALRPDADAILVDATFGRGGHTRALMEHLGPEGQLFAMDRDPMACAFAKDWASFEPRLKVIQAPFSKLSEELLNLGIVGKVSGIVLDLGVSSPQLDEPERGFSFMRDGPLDMRMDPTSGTPVSDWLMDVSEEDLIDVLRTLGEERFARRIARAIVEVREEKMLTSTTALADLVSECVPTREPGKHPATRTFQAFRIYINREMEELDAVLPQALEVLNPGGRLAVISFHSLEDRKVKNFFRKEFKGDPFPIDLPVTKYDLHPGIETVERPTRPSEIEVNQNPRARSAVLRSAQKSVGEPV